MTSRSRADRTQNGALPVPLPASAIPRATYRVQLHRGFTFADATALVPYLAALGVSHLYCSPYLRARPGSTHGYDVVDHRELNPEIGTREEFEAMVDVLARHDMSHLCDLVPNHMAVMGQDNAWWMDVLENGPASAYAQFFDIDWSPPDPELAGRVLVPVLGASYGEVLDRGELRVAFEHESGTFSIRYFEHRFPLDPREIAPLVANAAAIARDGRNATSWQALETLATRMAAMPSRNESSPEAVAERRRQGAACKRSLAGVCAEDASLRDAIDEAVERWATPGTTEGVDRLHRLLEAQAYRLAHWRVAGDLINYRRFFDINELAGVRTEDEHVFHATHDFLLGLAAEGKIAGLRIDHPDGLFDPARYFAALQERVHALAATRGTPLDSGIYVVLEKIAARHERMPAAWKVHGDTGYPFANAVVAVMADPTSRGRMDRVWRTFVGGRAEDFELTSYESKRTNMRGTLAAGLTTLASLALRIARADRHTRDLTFSTLRGALAETVAWFPVYRTYVSGQGASAQDRRYIDWAVARARRRTRGVDPLVYDFVRGLLLGEAPERADPDERERRLAFAMRFQQYTSPVAAKGVEDTAFYRHTRFVAFNDVGGDPGEFGITRRAFHRQIAERAAAWPHTLQATSTHDNKRSEDVRLRLDVLSEMPAAWRLAVRRWSRMNRSRKREVDGEAAPSRSDEYLLYQTLVGSLPVEAFDGDGLAGYRERIDRYMTKAAREAKVRTSWVSVDADYEGALSDFVGALLDDRPDNRFLADLRIQTAALAWYGMLNSLSATLLKLAVPGVPDFYQGTEILDFSLVDPDNRRPVDYDRRRELLAALEMLEAAGDAEISAGVRALLDPPYDGRAKLWIVRRALALRRDHRAIFDIGRYVPLTVAGSRTRHVIAFARRLGTEAVVAVVGRLFASLGLAPGEAPLGERAWADTSIDVSFLPSGSTLVDVLSGESLAVDEGRIALASALRAFPVALFAGSTKR